MLDEQQGVREEKPRSSWGWKWRCPVAFAYVRAEYKKEVWTGDTKLVLSRVRQARLYLATNTPQI